MAVPAGRSVVFVTGNAKKLEEVMGSDQIKFTLLDGMGLLHPHCSRGMINAVIVVLHVCLDWLATVRNVTKYRQSS